MAVSVIPGRRDFLPGRPGVQTLTRTFAGGRCAKRTFCPADLGRPSRETEHVCAARPVCPASSLHGVKSAFGIDEPLEPQLEAAMSWAQHRLRLVTGPRGQSAYPSPGGPIGCIAHAGERDPGAGFRSGQIRSKYVSVSFSCRGRRRPPEHSEVPHRSLECRLRGVEVPRYRQLSWVSVS